MAAADEANRVHAREEKKTLEKSLSKCKDANQRSKVRERIAEKSRLEVKFMASRDSKTQSVHRQRSYLGVAPWVAPWELPSAQCNKQAR